MSRLMEGRDETGCKESSRNSGEGRVDDLGDLETMRAKGHVVALGWVRGVRGMT